MKVIGMRLKLKGRGLYGFLTEISILACLITINDTDGEHIMMPVELHTQAHGKMIRNTVSVLNRTVTTCSRVNGSVVRNKGLGYITLAVINDILKNGTMIKWR